MQMCVVYITSLHSMAPYLFNLVNRHNYQVIEQRTVSIAILRLKQLYGFAVTHI